MRASNAKRKAAISLLPAALAVLVAVLATGLASGGSVATPAAAKRVIVADNFYSPRTVRVNVGGKVTWVWRGRNAHGVAFTSVPRGASKRGASPRRSGRFTRSFSKRGRYRYRSKNHPGMEGLVIAGR